jgi:transposase
MEAVSWLDRYARMTRRLADAVIQACERPQPCMWPNCSGCIGTPLLERRALQAVLSELPKAQPRRLVMDEFALFKGHRYASVVLDADTRRVLWIGEGRSRAAVRPFFEELGPEGCAQIEAVAMDMNTAFDLEVRQHCPRHEWGTTSFMWWPNMAER